MSPKKNTRQRIIDGSRELFNLNGVSQVSTNHIADHLTISPGNLYYHFKNREEIVRSIFDEIQEQIEAMWSIQAENPIEIVRSYVDTVFSILFRYSFFFKELTVLMRRDELLQQRYASLQSEFISRLSSVFGVLAEAGIFVGIKDEKSRDSLATNVWIVAIYWFSFVDTSGTEQAEVKRAEILNQIMFLLDPYINESFAGAVKAFFIDFDLRPQVSDS